MIQSPAFTYFNLHTAASIIFSREKCGLYSRAASIRGRLILKGGFCLRKHGMCTGCPVISQRRPAFHSLMSVGGRSIVRPNRVSASMRDSQVLYIKASIND